MVERSGAGPAPGDRGLRRLPLSRPLGLAPRCRRHGGRPYPGSHLSIAAVAAVVIRPGSGPRRDHLRLSEPRALPYVSLGSVRALALLGLAQPFPLLVAPVVARVNPAQRARPAARDQRFRLRPVHVVLDALEHLAVGDPGRGEEDVVTTDQIVDAEHALEIRAGGLGFLFLFGVAGIELALDLA